MNADQRESYECATCGERVTYSDLAAVMFHEHRGVGSHKLGDSLDDRTLRRRRRRALAVMFSEHKGDTDRVVHVIHGRPANQPTAEPLRLAIDPGSASAELVAELLAAISKLHLLERGEPIVWTRVFQAPATRWHRNDAIGKLFACDHCGADCSASYVETKETAITFDGDRPVDVELTGEGVRCDPPCEPALVKARELLAKLERRPGIADDLADLNRRALERDE